MFDYRIPDKNQWRCRCGRLVRLTNTYLVQSRWLAKIHARLTKVISTVRVCVRCKHETEQIEAAVAAQIGVE